MNSSSLRLEFAISSDPHLLFNLYVHAEGTISAGAYISKCTIKKVFVLGGRRTQQHRSDCNRKAKYCLSKYFKWMYTARTHCLAFYFWCKLHTLFPNICCMWCPHKKGQFIMTTCLALFTPQQGHKKTLQVSEYTFPKFVCIVAIVNASYIWDCG